ncbi:hypothetical protein AA13595_2801 [Gluconacetobacter johannae DSM 13595]|nr:hypothetical protein AA13595_2801 [Gluconacetobacter johannae DSM 13595]
MLALYRATVDESTVGATGSRPQAGADHPASAARAAPTPHKDTAQTTSRPDTHARKGRLPSCSRVMGGTI